MVALKLSAATLYVSLESTNPVVPYSTWSSAATNIQDAVDLAQTGDMVLVSNGVYVTGNRDVGALNTYVQPPYWMNVGLTRVVVTNAIRLESVNGPLVTIIRGTRFTNEMGYATNGIRGVYLGNGAVLSGFTLTNGLSTGVGGGCVACSAQSFITNCIIAGNYACDGGGVSGGTLWNCNLKGNEANSRGGGAFLANLKNCTLHGNSAFNGGGASDSTLNDCTLTGNTALAAMGFERITTGGGGANRCTLDNCTLVGNRANFGGGALECTLANCVLTENSATGGDVYDPDWGYIVYHHRGVGGGANGGTLKNCTLNGNSAEDYGGVGDWGGTTSCTLYNCLLTGNSMGSRGTFFNCTLVANHGGIEAIAFNSILYYNFSGNYVQGSTLTYCCTSPLPTNGVGNITRPPLFMDITGGDFRLWEGSPCIDAATNLLSFSGSLEPIDILGNTRFIDGNGDGTVAWDIGAYEFNSFKPPRFSSPPQMTEAGWRLTVTGATNKWVQVERSSNLVDWESIPPLIFMGDLGMGLMSDLGTGGRMFYRAYVPQ